MPQSGTYQQTFLETGNVGPADANTVKVWVDNGTNPQFRFVDDNNNSIQILDTRNTATVSGKTFSSPTLTTPNIGVATGTSLAVTGLITSSGSTNGIGYVTGAGGTITQTTSKATAVTLSKVCGTIVTTADALAAATAVSFTWTNTVIAATDFIGIRHGSGGTMGAYNVVAVAAAGSATVTIYNLTAGSLSEALTLNFVIIKAVVA